MNPQGEIQVERLGRVAIVTLTRPEKHNALTQNMRAGLSQALDQLSADDSVGVLVLRGAGDTAFCAGMDVAEFKDQSGLDQWRRDIAPGRIYEAFERFAKPIIAMVDGYAFGGGCELALACDIRICSERSQFGQLEINFGLIPGGGATQRLTRLAGRGQAMRLILSGNEISGAEAFRIGLVEMLVPDSTLLATTLELAHRIAAHHPVPLELAKAAIVSADELSLSSGLRYEASLMGIGLFHGAQKQRIDAFSGERKLPANDLAPQAQKKQP